VASTNPLSPAGKKQCTPLGMGMDLDEDSANHIDLHRATATSPPCSVDENMTDVSSLVDLTPDRPLDSSSGSCSRSSSCPSAVSSGTCRPSEASLCRPSDASVPSRFRPSDASVTSVSSKRMLLDTRHKIRQVMQATFPSVPEVIRNHLLSTALRRQFHPREALPHGAHLLVTGACQLYADVKPTGELQSFGTGSLCLSGPSDPGSQGDESHELLYASDSGPTETLHWDLTTYTAIIKQEVADWVYTDNIGQGTWGVVFQGKHKQDKDRLCAVKVVPINPLEDDVDFQIEVDMLQTLDHPNIVSLHQVVILPHFCCMVLELLEGGTLFDYVVARTTNKQPFSEDEVRKYTWPILSALTHIHRHSILHRDLKLENIMLTAQHEIRMVDFGLCKPLAWNGTAATLCGTPQYQSPEVKRGEPYSYPVDIWSLGVMLYTLLTLRYPEFDAQGSMLPKSRQRLLRCSRHAINLVSEMLHPDPHCRLLLQQVVRHPFMAVRIPAEHQSLYNEQSRWGQGLLANRLLCVGLFTLAAVIPLLPSLVVGCTASPPAA